MSLTSPLEGATLPRNTTVPLTATATDALGVTAVRFYVNGSLKGTASTPTYTYAWKVPLKAGRTYRLLATATDAAGNVGSSTIVTVTAR